MAHLRTSNRDRRFRSSGFTLIELSIVLVIIGLIIGGVLVGQDLIGAAGTRAQISQIQKYESAVRTFQTKYGGYLPGDIPDPYASQFGLAARGQYSGQGDGNGIVEGAYANAPSSNSGRVEGYGETVMFWVDLSAVRMIDGSFTKGTPNIGPGTFTDIGDYFPAAKLGQGNYVYVFENYSPSNPAGGGVNYYGVSAVTSVVASATMNSTPGMTVAQGYNIDKKIDDGQPQTGNVVAYYIGNSNWPTWASNNTNDGGLPFTTATGGSASTCFDNGGNTGVTQQYSMEIGNGSNPNCALAFKFQ